MSTANRRKPMLATNVIYRRAAGYRMLFKTTDRSDVTFARRITFARPVVESSRLTSPSVSTQFVPPLIIHGSTASQIFHGPFRGDARLSNDVQHRRSIVPLQSESKRGYFLGATKMRLIINKSPCAPNIWRDNLIRRREGEIDRSTVYNGARRKYFFRAFRN